jgi:hypothetical protein
MCVNYHQNQKNDLESFIQVLQIVSSLCFFSGKKAKQTKQEIKNGGNYFFRTRLLACTHLQIFKTTRTLIFVILTVVTSVLSV